MLLRRKGTEQVSLTCDSKDRARRHGDLVKVVFQSEDGCARDVCAECWRLLNGGDIKSEHEEGADAAAQKKRFGDKAIQRLLD